MLPELRRKGYPDDLIIEIKQRYLKGENLKQIAEEENSPSRKTLQLWKQKGKCNDGVDWEVTKFGIEKRKENPNAKIINAKIKYDMKREEVNLHAENAKGLLIRSINRINEILEEGGGARVSQKDLNDTMRLYLQIQNTNEEVMEILTLFMEEFGRIIYTYVKSDPQALALIASKGKELLLKYQKQFEIIK